MAQLLDLSAEIILSIAFLLRRADLLNISLTCKRLNVTTEPALFREYRNRRLKRSHPLSKFVLRIVKRPNLAKYVKVVDVKGWDTLDSFNPKYYEVAPQFEQTREAKQLGFCENRDPEPTMEEYVLCTEAAKNAGIIESIFPYEQESSVLSRAKSMLSSDLRHGTRFYTYLFDKDTPMQALSSDQKFCQLLRAGIEDPFAMLLFAILPNVGDIFLRGANSDGTALHWPRPKHGFKALRRLRAGGMDMQLPWGIGYLNSLLDTAELDEFMVHNAASWFPDADDDIWPGARNLPINLRPGSLRLKRLELVSCVLNISDMRILLRACPQLKSLYYSAGIEENEVHNFTPHELCELLEPLKDVLEELYMEIIPQIDDFMNLNGRITTLSHFTALKVLDTVPEMWEHLIEEDVGGDISSAEERLCNRLPSSLVTLIFHLGHESLGFEDDLMPDLQQIKNLILSRSETLPHLENIFLGLKHEYIAEEMEEMLAMIPSDQHQGLKFEIGTRDAAVGPTQNAFHNIPMSRELPATKWFGNKYATRKPREREYDQKIKELCNLPENIGLNDQEMMEVIRADARIQELGDQIKREGFPEVEYESEDIEEDYW